VNGNKIMVMLKRFLAFGSDTRGNALALCAAAMPLMVGAAGMALDTVQISLAKREMQRAADSAAMAGAYAQAQEGEPQPAVTRDLEVNNDVRLSRPADIENPPAAGPFAGSPRAVRVTLTAQLPLSFFSFFSSEPATVVVRATAASVADGEFCMLALDRSNVTNVTIGGNTRVDIGCGLASNSSSSQAIVAGGSSFVQATPIMAVGNVPASGSYAPGTELLPFVAPQVNPYQGLPMPTPSNCQSKLSIQPHQTRTISPGSDGTACYNGIDISGNVTFAPGTYYINGDSLNFGAQAVVTGTNVTFVLTSTNATSNPSSVATMSMNGGAVLNLTSPTTGPLKGILFYEDPRAPAGRSIRFNGNSASSLEGGLYFPRAYLDFNGTAGMRTRCMQMIANRLQFSGNSRIENICPAEGGGRAFRGTSVKLVA
jgi:hypothetical protein